MWWACGRSLHRLSLGLAADRPPRCARCGAPTAWPVARCRECAGRLCVRAGGRRVRLQRPARPFVRGWKERGLRRLAPWQPNSSLAHIERPAADVITPIPADAVRQLRRGRHPAEGLADELARRWELDRARASDRSGKTARQTGRRYRRERRRANIHGRCRRPYDPPEASRARRRRLHNRCDRIGRCNGTPEGRCAGGARRDLRAHDSVRGLLRA